MQDDGTTATAVRRVTKETPEDRIARMRMKLGDPHISPEQEDIYRWHIRSYETDRAAAGRQAQPVPA